MKKKQAKNGLNLDYMQHQSKQYVLLHNMIERKINWKYLILMPKS